MLRALSRKAGRCGAAGRRCAATSTVPGATETVDVAVVGAGHNGLVAAVLLARQGLKVTVLEQKAMVGGATKTEYPFPKVPGLGTSTGAYLLGVMPPELIALLGINVPLCRRDPHYFLPTTGSKHLLFGADQDAVRAQFLSMFSEQDWKADEHMQAELAALREDIAPSWLAPPLSLEATAERYVRPPLRRAFLSLCRRPVNEYLDRFGFRSDLLRAMYAVTDGFSGLTGGWGSPGTGINFLAHNMCRLPGSGGTWMVAQGGMGTVARQLALKAMEEGATIQTASRVEEVVVEQGVARGVRLAGGRELRARAVLVNADPFVLRQLSGAHNFPASFNTRLDGMQRDGTTMKVNLALRGLPQFTCLPEDRGQHRATIHLLPDEGSVIQQMQQAFADVQAGQLPDFPTIEWYIHTTVDPSLQDEQGHHNSALFVQWVPYQLANGRSWHDEEGKYVSHLLSICDRFAPGTTDLVVDTFALTPPKIESHFGITRGHIHHLDNSIGFDQRFPYTTPIAGLYSASAGCHPAGSVIGCAGHNAAVKLVQDLDLLPIWAAA